MSKTLPFTGSGVAIITPFDGLKTNYDELGKLIEPRVITLSPANTELAFAAGITPVGVSSYSDYPPQAQKIEQVSTWQGMTQHVLSEKSTL